MAILFKGGETERFEVLPKKGGNGITQTLFHLFHFVNTVS